MQPDAIVKLANRLHWLFTILLTATFTLEIILIFAAHTFSGWLEAILILLATASTITALRRQLPLQNVFLAVFGIALIGGITSMIGARTGIPFGPVTYEIEPQISRLPWALPLLWVVIILNSRGVARLILRPWRKTKTYGFWLIGVTAALVVAFDFALETFAHMKHFWLWMPTTVPFAWQGAPLSNFFSWFAVTVLILAFITPALINKQLSKHSVPDFHPLWLWVGAILIFTIASATHKLWPAFAVDAAIGIIAATFAVRGARW
jgi:uncharacterized membrane protein